MKQLLWFFSLLAIAGCRSKELPQEIVAQQYIHKYGYALSPEEWNADHCPGQHVVHRTDGVSITYTYEDSILHGPTTYTFAHSQMVQRCEYFKRGEKTKEVIYNNRGMPVSERVALQDNRYVVTLWYADGVPRLMEEYEGDRLMEGKYFARDNELESHVDGGSGVRLSRDIDGQLESREEFEAGRMVYRERLHANGIPQCIENYDFQGRLHGARCCYSPLGEPILVESYCEGFLDGKALYFSQGNLMAELCYVLGKKTGIERRLIDGERVFEEISWHENLLHGPTIRYLNDFVEEIWYYNGNRVTRKQFEESSRLDELLGRYSRVRINQED